MSVLNWILSKLFTYVLFPLIVLGTFACLVIFIVAIVDDNKDEESKVRAVIAAAVPVIVVVFLHVTSEKWLGNFGSALVKLSMRSQIFSGALLGFVLAESAHWFRDSLSPLYTLVLSSLAMFMVILFMNGFLLDISFILFGLVVTAALYTSLFRGIPS